MLPGWQECTGCTDRYGHSTILSDTWSEESTTMYSVQWVYVCMYDRLTTATCRMKIMDSPFACVWWVQSTWLVARLIYKYWILQPPEFSGIVLRLSLMKVSDFPAERYIKYLTLPATNPVRGWFSLGDYRLLQISFFFFLFILLPGITFSDRTP